MKKCCFLVSLFLTLTVAASAQLSWGVKAGFNASNLTGLEDLGIAEGNYSYSNNYRPGFHVGVAAQYMFTTQMGLESGLYYSMLGSKEEYDVKGLGKTTFTNNPSYIQLPISFIYKFNIGENFYLYPSLGLYLGYGIGGKCKIKAVGSGIDATAEFDRNFFGKDKFSGNFEITDELIEDNPEIEMNNRFDMGGTVGINLQYTKFTIGLGYDYGFLKVNKHDNYNFAGKKVSDNHNSNIKVSLGYFF